ncbi:MAG TPA: hypothetical protein VJI73_01930 [Candidatus Paceibacterota bacterium]
MRVAKIIPILVILIGITLFLYYSGRVQSIGVGSFKYSSDFTLLLPEHDAEAMNRVGFIPLCYESDLQCLVLSGDKYYDTNFETAAISLNIDAESKNMNDCMYSGEIYTELGTITIGGVQFSVSSFGDGATGHTTGGNVYRTFHDETCYIISAGINLARYNEDVDMRRFGDTEYGEVMSRLESIVATFRFN